MKTGNHIVEAKDNNESRGLGTRDTIGSRDAGPAGRGQSENEKLLDELSSERDARLRLAAEYDNYRRRTKLESSRAADEGKRGVIEQLLTIADDLDLALENLDGSADAVAEGLKMIERRFHDVLESNGVRPFESAGERFDPELHEAFDVARDAGVSSGTVFREVRRGYLWNEKLLRPALVVVAK
jgi:molecular chaperone GrpE